MEMEALLRVLGLIGTKGTKNDDRLINVRFPSMVGDTNRTMTLQELKKEYKDYLIIDPKVGEQVNLKDLANLEISEVVAMPPIAGG